MGIPVAQTKFQQNRTPRHRMDKSFRRAVVRAGLEPKIITPHVMRHTAITKLVKAGIDLPTIQRISGHKTLAMVLRYTHVHGSHINQAIRNIGLGLPENTIVQKCRNLIVIGEQTH
jgi:site-specific recombinase XerD